MLPGLKSDREIVLAAVGQDGRALEYAAAELKKRSPAVPNSDRGIVLAELACGRHLRVTFNTRAGCGRHVEGM